MRLLPAALLLCLAAPACASPMDVYENELDYLLREALMANTQGSELAALMKGRGKLPALCLDDKDVAEGREWDAYYYKGKICFNLARVKRFYGREKDPTGDLDWYSMSRQMGTMRDLARELAPDYYHELVHCWQYQLVHASALPAAESEYEAYLRTALFFNEQVKADPAMLARQAAEITYSKRTDSGYKVSANVPDYFSLCNGRKAFFGGIDDIYAGLPTGPEGPIDGDDPARVAYTAGVKRLIDRTWPALWKDAALNGGRAALTAGAHRRALRCLLPDPVEVRTYGLPKADESAIYGEGERALTFALMKLRAAQGEESDFDEYAGLFRAVEEALARINRALPSDLAAKRPEVYERARKFYSGKLAVEKDKGWRAYLRSALKYFSR